MKRHFSPGAVTVLLVFAALAAGCASTGDGRVSDSRYTMDQDAGPERHFDVSTVVEPEPRYEPPTSAGNQSPYEVWGETYEVMDSAQGYESTGTASWYGRKFHGHKTSNGETYDMFELTAAHRSLPLPTFLRVTNLKNERSTIVRVNDRGPFHGDRLIDLSYAAARVLGFQGQGTARVHIEAVATRPPSQDSGEEVDNGEKSKSLFVQVGAFGNLSAATQLRDQLFLIAGSRVHLVEAALREGVVHRVWVGPFDSRTEAEQEKSVIERNNLGQPIIISRPLEAAG
jgi:rare lipoprotein A